MLRRRGRLTVPRVHRYDKSVLAGPSPRTRAYVVARATNGARCVTGSMMTSERS
jgi:hypothetical protein